MNHLNQTEEGKNSQNTPIQNTPINNIYSLVDKYLIAAGSQDISKNAKSLVDKIKESKVNNRTGKLYFLTDKSLEDLDLESDFSEHLEDIKLENLDELYDAISKGLEIEIGHLENNKRILNGKLSTGYSPKKTKKEFKEFFGQLVRSAYFKLYGSYSY